MKCGQRVHLKAASHVAVSLKLPPETQGTIICSYKLLDPKLSHREFVDVRLDANRIIWGVLANEFQEDEASAVVSRSN